MEPTDKDVLIDLLTRKIGKVVQENAELRARLGKSRCRAGCKQCLPDVDVEMGVERG